MNFFSTKYKKIAVEISRVLIGIVFIFSGFVKVVDPWGYTYKILDYLEAFGMTVFNSLALPASIFISCLEFVLGVCILLGIYRKFSSIVVMLFMCFMTPLTFYLAIANPVHDCGCFGDAIIITNWQTFFKNIVLLIATIILFLWNKHMRPAFPSRKAQNWSLSMIILFILGVSVYCYLYLPILDFRPYKIGNNISELMEIPEGAPTDEYEVTFIYAKDGVEKEFTIDNYPKTDDWTFVDRIDKLTKKGYEPPISDFSVYNEDDEDITDIILEDNNYTFLLIAWKLEQASDSNIDKINDLYDYCLENDYNFYCLTSSLPADIEEWKKSTAAEYPFLNVDGITLKTIVRSNPGLVLLKEGTVINKWPNRCIPGENDLLLPLNISNLGKQPENHDTRNIVLLSLVLILPLAFIYGINLHQGKRRKKKKSNKAKSK